MLVYEHLVKNCFDAPCFSFLHSLLFRVLFLRFYHKILLIFVYVFVLYTQIEYTVSNVYVQRFVETHAKFYDINVKIYACVVCMYIVCTPLMLQCARSQVAPSSM